MHSEHYVAHILLPHCGSVDGDQGWVLFNDEKVVVADRTSVEELEKLAYLCVSERVWGCSLIRGYFV